VNISQPKVRSEKFDDDDDDNNNNNNNVRFELEPKNRLFHSTDVKELLVLILSTPQ